MVALVLPVGEVANNINKMKETLINQLNKTGETPYYVSNIEILDENIPFLPVSQINEIRREILSLLSKERLSNFVRLTQNLLITVHSRMLKLITMEMYLIMKQKTSTKNVIVK